MNPLNSILLEGNLTKDPNYKMTKNGTPVCTFAVASNRYYKKNGENQDEVSFFNVETWSRLADTCSEYLKKGRGVRVVGRLKQDRWMDTEGKPQTKVKIVAEHVEFRPDFKGRKADSDESEENADEDTGEENEESAESNELQESEESVTEQQEVVASTTENYGADEGDEDKKNLTNDELKDLDDNEEVMEEKAG